MFKLIELVSVIRVDYSTPHNHDFKDLILDLLVEGV